MCRTQTVRIKRAAFETEFFNVAIPSALSAIESMDRIVVLDEGQIIQEGILQQLLMRGGQFSKF